MDAYFRTGRSAALVVMLFALAGGAADTAEAKIPGKTHCYKSICHRVKTLAEMQGLVGTQTIVYSSYYDDCRVDRHNTCALTSSGEVFKPHNPDNAASPIYPDGTTLLVWNPKTRAAAVVRVNSAGPYHSNRTLDVSRATAEKLGFKRSGVAQLHVQVLTAPTEAESRYKKHRTYAAVPGPIGMFESFQTAMADTARLLPVFGAGAATLLADGRLPRGEVERTEASVRLTRSQIRAARAEARLLRRLKITRLEANNAKVVNTASRNATVAVVASVAGGASPTTTISASAVLMNSIPHSLLPPGVLTGRTVQGRRNGRAVADRGRKVVVAQAPRG